MLKNLQFATISACQQWFGGERIKTVETNCLILDHAHHTCAATRTDSGG
jgi:hypothetical protein